MRWLVLALCACGRLGFDPLADTEPPTDAPRDSPAVTCTPVGNDDDADGVDDACDVCPHIPGTQADRDGDRVGDACDPNPEAPRDTIVVFDSFEKPDPRWTFGNGSQIVNSKLVVTAIGQSWAGSYAMTPGNDRFIVGGVFRARGTSNQQIFSLLMFQGPAKYYCEIYDDASLTKHQLSETLDGSMFNAHGTMTVPNRVDDKEFIMTLFNSRPNVKCTTKVGTEYAAPGTISEQYMPAQVALNVIDRNVELFYFVQIRTN